MYVILNKIKNNKFVLVFIQNNCKLIGLKLNELTKKFPSLDAIIIAIIRGDKSFIPKKNF